MQQFAIVASVAVTSVAIESAGDMTLGGSVVGASCEYANEQDGGHKSPAATSQYIASRRYCAADAKKFANGAGCGACYNVSYSGEGGTDPGRPGWAVVQVVDLADSVDFACHGDVFDSVTGATTGVFPITYKPVACETTSASGVAMVLDGDNAYYTKAIFSDLPYAVAEATLKVGRKSFPMQRVGGATFMASTDGTAGAASFDLTLADGGVSKVAPCFEEWPVATDSSCGASATRALVV
jgi:hypothetical protein